MRLSKCRLQSSSINRVLVLGSIFIETVSMGCRLFETLIHSAQGRLTWSVERQMKRLLLTTTITSSVSAQPLLITYNDTSYIMKQYSQHIYSDIHNMHTILLYISIAWISSRRVYHLFIHHHSLSFHHAYLHKTYRRIMKSYAQKIRICTLDTNATHINKILYLKSLHKIYDAVYVHIKAGCKQTQRVK